MTSFNGTVGSNAFIFRRGFVDRDLILSRNVRNPRLSPTTRKPARCRPWLEPSNPPYSAAERERTGASVGSDQTLPSRTARKLHPFQSFLARAGPVPRSPTKQRTPKTLLFGTRRPSPKNMKQCPLLCK